MIFASLSLKKPHCLISNIHEVLDLKTALGFAYPFCILNVEKINFYSIRKYFNNTHGVKYTAFSSIEYNILLMASIV